MKKKMLTFLGAVACAWTLAFATTPAMAGTAANVATSWGLTTTLEENFNFGNPASTSDAKLPTQVQTAIDLGTLAAYFNAALLFGF
ncbi:MAG: hypothetical protein ACP59X_20355 [Solidesulfovibrio sp. DCME]|uniref:hypothetical protein n=1 Tax=Solidesulfovibrio sp. DCME TaxID=3447380 RepID=UPI003D120B7B